MWKTLAAITSLTLYSTAFAGPGIDISANKICPGVTGASGNGGALDCAALVAAGAYVSVLGTFVPAEDVPDVIGFHGAVDVDIIGNFLDRDVGGGAFWLDSDGTCVDQHGGKVVALQIKPTEPGTQCGNAIQVRPIWSVGISGMPPLEPSVHHHARWNFFMGGSGLPGTAITRSQRIFGFEMRFDPAQSHEGGGACGTCTTPVCFTWVFGQLETADPDRVTTTLTTPTGLPGVSNVAFFNAGCAPVPTQSRTWGRLKSLYR